MDSSFPGGSVRLRAWPSLCLPRVRLKSPGTFQTTDYTIRLPFWEDVCSVSAPTCRWGRGFNSVLDDILEHRWVQVPQALACRVCSEAKRTHSLQEFVLEQVSPKWEAWEVLRAQCPQEQACGLHFLSFSPALERWVFTYSPVES